MFAIKTYKYKGFDVEEMEGGAYRFGMFQYKTLREVVSQIDQHINARIQQLRQDQQIILDGRYSNKTWHEQAQKRVKALQDAIDELEAKQ